MKVHCLHLGWAGAVLSNQRLHQDNACERTRFSSLCDNLIVWIESDCVNGWWYNSMTLFLCLQSKSLWPAYGQYYLAQTWPSLTRETELIKLSLLAMNWTEWPPPKQRLILIRPTLITYKWMYWWPNKTQTAGHLTPQGMWPLHVAIAISQGVTLAVE